MSNLSILNTDVRSYENLFNLKDLHLASGGLKKNEPYLFIRLDTTKELIAEIESEAPNTKAVKTLRGTHGGTYACEELVIAYAAWISAAFHLKVIRAFMAMHKGEVKQQQLALPEPEKKYTFEFTEYELEQLAWLWFGHKQMNTLLGELYEPLEALGSRFSGMVYSHSHEYKLQYEETQITLQRLIQPFIKSNRLNWKRVIPKICPPRKLLGF